jgi:hypothetical protein
MLPNWGFRTRTVYGQIRHEQLQMHRAITRLEDIRDQLEFDWGHRAMGESIIARKLGTDARELCDLPGHH